MLNWLPAPAARALRKLMLSQGRRMNRQRMLQRSHQRAMAAAVQAARHSAAYRVLLHEQGLDAAALRAGVLWQQLPVLTKANTFERFTLAQLSRPIAASALADVLTSSGRSSGSSFGRSFGRSFGFRLTSRPQHETSWFDIDLGLQDFFDVDHQATLLVNCLPMGVVFRSRAVTVANVSVREDMACSILRDVGPRFAQTILCTDPLFIRRLLDQAHNAGVDWSALRTSVIVGEELLVEAQRDFIAARMGIDLDGDPGCSRGRTIGSSFGVGELGLNLLFETRETIRMRRALRAHGQPAQAHALLGAAASAGLPALFCFNPLRCYVEVLGADAAGFGELCITMLDAHSVIPLPRYATGDWGKLVSPADCTALAALAATPEPWLPVVAVAGRIKDRVPGLPSVERIKELIYSDHAVADQLSGAFRLQRDAAGAARLMVQANAGVNGVDVAVDATVEATFQKGSYPALAQRLMDLYKATEGPAIAGGLYIEVVAAEAFPWRPTLDFERKFAYLAPADEAA